MTGKQSLLFDKDVYVRCAATVVGKKEADGPLGEMFDVAVEDDMFGKKSWEAVSYTHLTLPTICSV